MSTKKRLCLFAGFDANGCIADYVVYFIKALSAHSDVYYFGDFPAANRELKKLEPYCKAAYAKRHGKYDFGSWQELIKLIGRKKIEQYDEIILTNDSCYGPLYDLKDLFSQMDAEPCDFWGLTAAHYQHIHIQSYFMVLKHKIITSNIFYDFMQSVKPEKSFNDVCRKYEVRLTYILASAGFTFKTFIPCDNLAISPYYDTERAIKEVHFPLLKVKFFLGGIRDQGPVSDWRKMLNFTDYPINLIEENLLSRGLNLAEVDINVKTKTREGYVHSFSLKAQIKHFIKFLLSPVFMLLDRVIIRHITPLNNQYSKMSRRIHELSNQLAELSGKKDVKPTAHLISQSPDNTIQLAKIDTFLITPISETLIPNDDARILTIGNFSDYNSSAFSLDTHDMIALNNAWTSDVSPDSSFTTKYFTDFRFEDTDHQPLFFDFILTQPIYAKTSDIKTFINSLKAHLLYESVLIMSIPKKQTTLYQSLLTAAGLVPVNTWHGLSIEPNPYLEYYDKIDVRKGYKLLIYKIN